ncbi:MAG: hypothetical protein Q8P40_08555 [Nitrospirota bacterium]|nr:hypothetical protein [Nitrospirota bacterium]
MDSEKVPAPDFEKMPTDCPVCDLMISLGLASATCANLPKNEQNKCHQMLKPLEDKKVKAVDAIADLIIEFGDKNINESIDRFNKLVWEATLKAKERMIISGKLTAEGFPIELKTPEGK